MFSRFYIWMSSRSYIWMSSRSYFVVVVANSLLKKNIFSILLYVIVANSLSKECLLDLTSCHCSKLTFEWRFDSRRYDWSTQNRSIIVASAISTFVLVANSLQKTYLRSRARYERIENFIVMSNVMQWLIIIISSNYITKRKQ